MKYQPTCEYCGKVLPSGSRGNQLYCGPKHGRQARKDRDRPKHDEQIAALRNGTWLHENRFLLERAERDIVGGAPRGAAGYVALTPLEDGSNQVFPDVGHGQKSRRRVDGSNSTKPFFELIPAWEPPRVPETATYGIAYIDARGHTLSEGKSVELPGCFMPKPRQGIHGSEIEKVLLKHPTVDQCAVVGRSVGKYRIARAFVVLRPSTTATEEELLKFLWPRLSEYKWPRSIRILPSAPVDATGRIIKKLLPSD